MKKTRKHTKRNDLIKAGKRMLIILYNKIREGRPTDLNEVTVTEKIKI